MSVLSGSRRRWMWVLVVGATLLVGLAAEAKEPVKVQAARRAFNDAYRHQKWERAIEIGYELVEMVPGPGEQYNLACVFALAGDETSALHWLAKAAANGFAYFSVMESDSDLDSLRDSPGYAKIRDLVVMNLDRHRAELIREAAEVPPLTVLPRGDGIDGPRPLIIVLHGHGGHAEEYPAVWGPAAQEIGAILAVPQGAKRVGAGRAWTDVNEAEAIVRLTIDYVRSRFEVDWDRVVLTGFSQGGFMATAVAGRHPRIFTGVIPMAGPYIPGIDAPPPAEAGDPRYYFMVGSLDRVEDEVRQAATDFEHAGYEVDLRVYLGTGHTFPRATKKELVRALKFVLGE